MSEWMGEGGAKTLGIVSAIRTLPGSYRYTLLSGGAVTVESPQRFELNETVEVSYSAGGALLSKSERRVDYRAALEDAVAKVRLGERASLLKKRGFSRSGPLDRIAVRMLPKLVQAAEKLLRAAISGAPIVVRFHGDGDGSTGAVCLYRAIEALSDSIPMEPDVRWALNRGISYSVESFYYDTMHFNEYESVEKPLVCIIDFGTTEESNDALKKAVERFDMVWLDHHPMPKGFLSDMLGDYINPTMFKGTSDFTAGFLAGVFSELLADIHVREIMEASLISDFSAYADRNDGEASRIATVLDFVTGIKNSTRYLDGPVTPAYLSKLISDQEKMRSVHDYAHSMIEDAIEMGIERSKRYMTGSGIPVNVIDFVHIADKYGGYLLPGRYSSRLQGRLEETNPDGSITIVNFRNAISIRVSKHIAGRVKLLDVIESLKESPDIVVSGGGHKEAASVMAAEGQSEAAIRLLLGKLGAS